MGFLHRPCRGRKARSNGRYFTTYTMMLYMSCLCQPLPRGEGAPTWHQQVMDRGRGLREAATKTASSAVAVLIFPCVSWLRVSRQHWEIHIGRIGDARIRHLCRIGASLPRRWETTSPGSSDFDKACIADRSLRFSFRPMEAVPLFDKTRPVRVRRCFLDTLTVCNYSPPSALTLRGA